ncbi:hypothetical protein BgiMline_022635, partial [Biomphalaria glabrata]
MGVMESGGTVVAQTDGKRNINWFSFLTTTVYDCRRRSWGGGIRLRERMRAGEKGM